jgi:hypothetical protein
MSAQAFFAGLDLGQAQDFTALAVVEATDQAAGRSYAVRHLERWQLKTAYPAIVDDVARLFEQPPLTGAPLCVDATGVGRAVVDLFRTSKIHGRLMPITLTGSEKRPVPAEGGWRVPKRELVGVMQVLLGGRRFQVAPALEHAKTLAKEMQTFQVKINLATGNESFEAWRERDHDDLVLAVALACWFAERGQRPGGLVAMSFRCPLPGEPAEADLSSFAPRPVGVPSSGERRLIEEL